MAITAASAATMVLPQPTSPCNRRFMGRASFMSPAISPSTRFCAPVGLNGSMAFIFSRTRWFSADEFADQGDEPGFEVRGPGRQQAQGQLPFAVQEPLHARVGDDAADGGRSEEPTSEL